MSRTLLGGVKEDFFDLTHALGSWRFWQTVLAMAFGLTLFSVSINGVLIPNHFNASGATGIALGLFYLLGRPSVGVLYWMLNVPILYLGWRAMSLKFVVLALIGVALSGATLQLTQGILLPVHEPMMAAIVGGTLSGLGVGTYLRFGGSAGGLDIVAALMRRRLGVPMGQTFITVNAINVAAAGFIGNSFELAFYTAIATFVHSSMVDRMQSGFSARKAAFIISSEPELLSREILRTLNRGCTFFHASGGMSGRGMKVIYTVVSTIELARLKQILYHIDANAFMAVSNASEVIGNRFVSWEQEGYSPPRRGKPPSPPG